MVVDGAKRDDFFHFSMRLFYPVIDGPSGAGVLVRSRVERVQRNRIVCRRRRRGGGDPARYAFSSCTKTHTYPTYTRVYAYVLFYSEGGGGIRSPRTEEEYARTPQVYHIIRFITVRRSLSPVAGAFLSSWCSLARASSGAERCNAM